jgi:hypothetical protein
MERFKGDIKETKKLNRKLQLRVQTFEKKLELQHIKEQRITEMLDKTNENFETKKLEQETYFLLVFRFFVSENILFVCFLFDKKAKTKEDEMNKTKGQMQEEANKLIELEHRLENHKSKSKERVNEVQEQ